MAVLLDLGRERAAAGRVVIRVEDLDPALDDRLAQASPFHRRVAPGVLGIQKLAVLDEEQRVEDDGGNGIEARIDPGRVARPEEEVATTVEDGEPRLALLGIRREIACVHELVELAGSPRLGLDAVTPGPQPVEVGGQVGVTQALVVRAAVGEPDRGAGARLHPEFDAGRLRGEVAGLERGGAGLVYDQDDRRDQKDDEHRSRNEQ